MTQFLRTSALLALVPLAGCWPYISDPSSGTTGTAGDADTDTDGGDTDTGSQGTDADGDGFTVEEGDCDDNDIGVNPGREEDVFDGNTVVLIDAQGVFFRNLGFINGSVAVPGVADSIRGIIPLNGPRIQSNTATATYGGFAIAVLAKLIDIISNSKICIFPSNLYGQNFI